MTRTAAPMNPLLKMAFEVGPLVAFFIANSRLGILPATAIFMGATTAALAASYAIARTIPVMPLISGAFVLVFGGLTIALEDELFIKLKPTIVNVCFAAILAIGLASGRLLIKVILEAAFQLTDRGWLILTRAWIGFFLLLAALNEIVWRNFSTDTWVNFKVFGVMPLTVLFSFALIPVIVKHTIPESAAAKSDGA
jgi:intracellular septation protein